MSDSEEDEFKPTLCGLELPHDINFLIMGETLSNKEVVGNECFSVKNECFSVKLNINEIQPQVSIKSIDGNNIKVFTSPPTNDSGSFDLERDILKYIFPMFFIYVIDGTIAREDPVRDILFLKAFAEIFREKVFNILLQ